MKVDTRWVAAGPTTGTWWCTLDDPATEHVAPGGVVLCVEGSVFPHPDAARAATSAWELLDLWQSQGCATRQQ